LCHGERNDAIGAHSGLIPAAAIILPVTPFSAR
jgi:hypothetical protein